MNLVHVIPGVGKASFGLGPVALNLVKEQNKLNIPADIWCLDDAADIKWAAHSCGLHHDRIHSFARSFPKPMDWSIAMHRFARQNRSNLSVIHQHGIWNGLSRTVAMLNRQGLPTVITPHGSMHRWALQHSRWKKRAALALYERHNLHCASCLHAVGLSEVDDIRDFGLRNPIAVIPNGIDHAWLCSEGSPVRFRKRFNIADGQRVLLSLSRITPKKGIPMFLDALQSSRSKLADWLFVIAGADEFGHLADIKKLIVAKGLTENVCITGSLFGQIKRDAFAAAEVFVLPTHSEGAPITILEALGAGVPVLTTHATPWKELNTQGCGWWVNASVSGLTGALADVLTLTAGELRKMGQNGKTLVTREYTWKSAGQRTLDLYQWLLGDREQPDFVVTN